MPMEVVLIDKAPAFKLIQYTGRLYSLSDWVVRCFNKFGYDIGLQVRKFNKGELISSQKIYYTKGDKYGQRLSERNPDEKIKLYFNDGSKETISTSEFYQRANDGDTIPSHMIVSDQDFEHQEIDLSDSTNPLFELLKTLDTHGIRYTVHSTAAGRGIKILFQFPGLMDYEKAKRNQMRMRMGNYLHSLIKGEIFYSGRQCSPCFPVIQGQEPIHAKTQKPIRIIHYTGSENNLEFMMKLVKEYEASLEPEDYAHLKRAAKQIFDYTDKLDLANKFWKIQPFFYDKARIWWLWDVGLKMWKIIDEVDLMNAIDMPLRKGITVKQKEKSEIIEAMKRVGRTRIPVPIKKAMIQFMDTIYDLDSGETIPATPDLFATNPIPHQLSESSETPNIDRILAEWVGEEYVKTLYEIVAYCLIPDYPLHRIFCLVGSGMNGKGKFLELISRFIGENNKTSTELDYILNSRFEVAKLYKKLVCLMGETNFTELSKTSLLKRLAGGDTIGYEFKNKDPFDDYNYAKIIIATNSLPITTDKTRGFYRRWLIVDFPNEFNEKKDVLAEIPSEEYNNLSKKCIEILKELMVRREFSNEGTISERQKRYEERSNPVAQFIKEKCVRNLNEKAPLFQFYDEFMVFSNQRGHRLMTKREVSRTLRNEGFEVEKQHVSIKGEDGIGKYTKWMFILGLRLKDPNNLEDYKEKESQGHGEYESGPNGPNGPGNHTGPYPCNLSGTSGPLGPTGPGNMGGRIPGEEIHLPCSYCGDEPSHSYDIKGKPICGDCAKSLLAGGFDIEEEFIGDMNEPRGRINKTAK